MITPKFEKAFRECLEDRGVIKPDWRIRIYHEETLGQSDFETVSFLAYPPRCRNPHIGNVKLNFVKKLIYWNTLDMTPDRIKSTYVAHIV